MPDPDTPPSPEPTLSRREKEQLLQKMYVLPHWIAVIRLFGYRTLTMDKARTEIKPIAEEFGKEKTAEACEVLVEIVPGKEPNARLKSYIRRMAFQILGAEPTTQPVTPMEMSPQEPQADSPPAHPQKTRTPRKRAAKVAPPAAVKAEPAADGQSAIMRQYHAAKEKHPDMLLLFRMGDFYELFGEDAQTVHRLLGLTLTTRDRTLTMAGFPHHQLEAYLLKLLKEGERVAICEPVDESLARGPIRREVTRVVTPGAPDKDLSSTETQRQPAVDARRTEEHAVKQPRHFVLKQFEAWLNGEGLAFVAVADVGRTTPAVKPYVVGLDYIVLRGEAKLLVTVRPHLQAKHLKAIGELQKLFGAEYRPVRIWPTDRTDGWCCQEHSIDISPAERLD